MSAVIADVLVEEGDRVKKGQVLFRLRTTDLALHGQQARAALAAAEVNLASVQVEHDRVKRLFDQKAIEQAQFDRASAQLEAARAGVAQAKVGVSMARQTLSDAEVRSPIDGVVTAKLKNAGEMATMMPPTVVVVIEDHSTLELRFRLPESQLGALAAGDTVKVSFVATGEQRDAKVVRVAPNVDPATRTVEVVATIDNADGKLRAGLLAKVARPGVEPPTPPIGERRSARPGISAEAGAPAAAGGTSASGGTSAGPAQP
jgi:RND family efflux transporter MFP subunit